MQRYSKLALLLVTCATIVLGCGSESGEQEVRTVTKTVTETVPEPEQEPTEEASSSESGGGTPQPEEVAQEQLSPEETLALQYEYINADRYEDAHSLFAPESQQTVSSEQYRTFFEAYAPYRLLEYSFPAADVQGDTATVDIEATVSSAATDSTQFEIVQQMVLVDGEWRVVMRASQIEAFNEFEPGADQGGTPGGQSPDDERDVEPSPASDPIVLTGSGQQATDLFELEAGLTIINMTHQGQANFIVDLLDEQGQNIGPLGIANVIGSFEGSTAVQTKAGQHLLDVEADGPWEITVEQPRPDEVPATRQFSGDSKQATELFQLSGGLKRINLTHQGDGNFIVDILNENGSLAEPMGLVNEIGPYDGSTSVTVPDDGAYLFSVEANGPWTINIEE